MSSAALSTEATCDEAGLRTENDTVHHPIKRRSDPDEVCSLLDSVTVTTIRL
jgi:hypothetical protein